MGISTNIHFACVFLAVVVGAAQAQTTPLTLDDCVNLALDAPSQVRVAERDVSIARAGQTNARSALLPQVSLNNSVVYNSPLTHRPDQFSFVAANGIREYLSVVDSTWEVDLSGRLRAGLALARANRQLAGADLRIARRDLRRAVASAYYDVLLARRIAQLEEDSTKEARSFETLIRARQQQGESSMADVHKAAAQRARFEQRLSQARLNARLANQVLASFWTADADRELDLQDVLDHPPAPPADVMDRPGSLADAVADRPEFDRLNALRSTYRAERTAARASLLPQTSVVFQYGIDANAVSMADRGYAAYVNLNLPLFDWSQRRSTARQARYRREQVDEQLAVAERSLSREYLAAAASVRSSFEQIPLARDELTESRENLRLSRLLYEGGEGLALDVVTAQTQAADAGTSLFTTLAAYFRALVDFEVASGK